MTNEEAKTFLNNLKIFIEEHPIVADWLVEIAYRKTENSSENPNNCEPTWEQVKEYCNKRCLDIVDSALRKKWYKDEPQTEDFQDWKDRMWAEAIVTEQKWTCARCGCENHADFKWCFKCGYHKPETDQTEEPYEYEIKALHKDHIEPYVIIEDDQTDCPWK